MLERVSVEPGALKHATEELKGDHEIVMTAVSKDGWALQHTTQELKSDREIVTAAVSENGSALQFATKDLKEDEEMLQLALGGSGSRGPPDVIGIKVTLMSGRCCSEVFWDNELRMLGAKRALRRCAASLDLDPHYVGSSVASQAVEKAWPSAEQEGLVMSHIIGERIELQTG